MVVVDNKYPGVKYIIDAGILRNIAIEGALTDAELEIPSMVKRIDRYAISRFTGVKSVFIPNSVKILSDSAFVGCLSLKDVVFEDESQLEIVGAYAFANCPNLQKMELPPLVKEIGENAFMGCVRLRELNIPKRVKELKSITAMCFNLKKLVIESNFITDSIFGKFSLTLRTMNVHCSKSVAEYLKITHPEIRTIARPDPVHTDANTRYLEYVDEDSLTTGVAADNNNSGYTIKEQGEILNQMASTYEDGYNPAETRRYQPSYAEGYNYDNAGAYIQFNAQYGDESNPNFTSYDSPYYMYGKPEKEYPNPYQYQQQSYSQEYQDPYQSYEQSYTQGYQSCQDSNQFALTTSEFSNSNSCSTEHDNSNSCNDFESNSFNNHEFNSNSYDVPYVANPYPGFKIIKDKLVACDLYDDRYIEIPDIVRDIDDDVFEYFTNLEYVALPVGLMRIGAGAFLNCTKLNNVIIPCTVQEIGSGAFWGCSSLEQLVMPYAISKLPSGVYAFCTSMKRIDFTNINKLGRYCFIGCSGLTRLVLPSGVVYDDMRQFHGIYCNIYTTDPNIDIVDFYLSAYNARGVYIPKSSYNDIQILEESKIAQIAKIAKMVKHLGSFREPNFKLLDESIRQELINDGWYLEITNPVINGGYRVYPSPAF